MATFRCIVNHQVKWVEADVDVIADETIIICHDSTLDWTTSRTGRYDDLTAADLAGIDTEGWFSPRLMSESLPALSGLTDLVSDSGPNAGIGIRPSETDKEAILHLVGGVVTQLERLRPDVRVTTPSFSHLLLLLSKQRAPEVPVGCLYEDRALSGDWRSTLEIVGADFTHPKDPGLARQQVQEFRDTGYGVNVWTVNLPSRADELSSWGATNVFPDVTHQAPGCRHLPTPRTLCENHHPGQGGGTARYIELHSINPQVRLVGKIADTLRDGGLVAYPTDPGYALACAPGSKEGLDRIRIIRQLDGKHGSTFVCADFAQVGSLTIMGNNAFRLIERFTPGPWAFILKDTRDIPWTTFNPKKHTPGMRIPDHAITQSLATELSAPIPSSILVRLGREEPEANEWEIRDSLGHLIDVVVEEPVGQGEPTSVIDLTDDVLEVLHEGVGDINLL